MDRRAWMEVRRGLEREGRVLARRYGSDRAAREAWERLRAYVSAREDVVVNVIRLAEPAHVVTAACPDAANSEAMAAAPWGPKAREHSLELEQSGLLLDRLANVLLDLAAASDSGRRTRSLRMPGGAEVGPKGRLRVRAGRG